MKVKILSLKNEFKNEKKCQNDFNLVDLNKEHEVFEVFGSEMGFKDKENNWHSLEIYDFDIIEWTNLKKFEEVPMAFHIMQKYFKGKRSPVELKDIEKIKELKDLSFNERFILFKNINLFLCST
jgi:hypothetical protein